MIVANEDHIQRRLCMTQPHLRLLGSRLAITGFVLNKVGNLGQLVPEFRARFHSREIRKMKPIHEKRNFRIAGWLLLRRLCGSYSWLVSLCLREHRAKQSRKQRK